MVAQVKVNCKLPVSTYYIFDTFTDLVEINIPGYGPKNSLASGRFSSMTRYILNTSGNIIT